VNGIFKTDMYDLCDRAGNPGIKNGALVPAVPCKRMADIMWVGVSSTEYVGWPLDWW
jgi:hypothetical protein